MITIKQLKSIPIFADFKQNELKEILLNSFTKTLIEKENVFDIDQKRDNFFVILSGRIAIARQFGSTNQIIEIANPGEFIAEHSLFDPKSKHGHSAQVYSKEAVLLAVPGKLFRKMPENIKYKLLLNLLPIISDNFAHSSNRIMTIFQIGQIISAHDLNSDELSREILKILLTGISAQKALVALRETNGDKIKIISMNADNFNNEGVKKIINLNDDYLMENIISQGHKINLSTSEYLSNKKCQVDYIDRSVFGLPLTINQKHIGAILLIDKKNADEFSANNEVLLDITAKMVALRFYQARQMEIKQAEEELKREYIAM